MNDKVENMEQSILEAAERLFLLHGFSATSTTMIAKEVGCNQALVHYYFRTKEKLFATIFESKFKLFFNTLFTMDNAENLSFNEKIRFIAESHFDMLTKNPKLPVLILGELNRRKKEIVELKSKLREMPAKLFKMLGSDLEKEISMGQIRNIDLYDLLITVLSLNISLFVLLPALEVLLDLDEDQKQALIAHRKAENIDFILKSLRP